MTFEAWCEVQRARIVGPRPVYGGLRWQGGGLSLDTYDAKVDKGTFLTRRPKGTHGARVNPIHLPEGREQ